MADADPTLAALEELVRVGRQNIANWLVLMERADRVRELRAQGVTYRDMNVEQGMTVIEAISDNQDRLTVAAAKFRRAMARELHTEGLTPAAIARLYGVSRQRVASLLAGSETAAVQDAELGVHELDVTQ
jgi:hypothetical protein